jgi:predicted permease
VPHRSADRIRREVDEELAHALEMRQAELVGTGLPEEEARQRAVKEFGDLEYTRRYCVEMDVAAERSRRRSDWLREAAGDVRLAWRGLVREPGFALIVLVVLALGIGANAAVLSVLREVLVEALPYAEPDRLVRLYGGRVGVPTARGMLAPAEVSALQQSDAFAGVAAFGNYGGITHLSDASAEMWSGVQVGPQFFSVLGVRPVLGRAIEARDVDPGSPRAVVLSHRLWQRSFAGDSSVIGRVLNLNGGAHTVVGVLAADFVSPDRDPDVWMPLDLSALLRDPIAAHHMKAFRAVGRLGEGVTPVRLQATMDRVVQRLRLESPSPDEVAPPNAVALREDMLGSVRPILLVVMSAAGLVLVLCCVNVAELLLTRATARRRELAIRSALGAGRGRLARQLLTESAVLALLGGALGIGVAFWWRAIFVDVLALLLPSARSVPIDGGVLAFALIVSVLCALAFGIAPALAGTRTAPSIALAESARGTAGGRARTRTGRILVGAQFALAAVLLIGASLLGRTLIALERTGVGFDTGGELVTFRVNLSADEYDDVERQTAFLDAFLARVRAQPGVRSVAAIGVSPWSGYTSFGPDSIFLDAGAGEVRTMASRVVVSEDWFATLGIPLRLGRAFSASDAAGSPPVAVLSESFASHHWPGANPLGRLLRIGSRDADVVRVVGVVGDVRARPTRDVQPTVYVPMRQNPAGGGEFVVRTGGRGLALVPALERALHEIDPRLPVAAPRTVEEIFDGMLAGQRLPLLFTGAFALLALVLAVLGAYGVMARTVESRRREVGIRVALGARPGEVMAVILRDGLTTAAIGTIVGVTIAALATPALSELLVSVTPYDAASFTFVPAILLAVSCAACIVPARRSLAVEPVEALRSE